MARRLSALLGAALLAAVPACLSGEDPDVFDVDVDAVPEGCVNGRTRACRCVDGPTGVQRCVDGTFGRCDCSASAPRCTLFPDCGGCRECFETCICHSEGDAEGCRETCLEPGGGPTGGAGAGGAGGSGPTSPCEACSAASCPDEIAACRSTPGCLDVIDCVLASGCSTSDFQCILGACGSLILSSSGVIGPAMALGNCAAMSCAAECG